MREFFKKIDFSSKHVLNCMKKATEFFLRDFAFHALGPLYFSRKEKVFSFIFKKTELSSKEKKF